MDDLVTQLIDSIQDDVIRHGGLVSRSTIRLCDELRLAMSRAKERERIDADPPS